MNHLILSGLNAILRRELILLSELVRFLVRWSSFSEEGSGDREGSSGGHARVSGSKLPPSFLFDDLLCLILLLRGSLFGFLSGCLCLTLELSECLSSLLLGFRVSLLPFGRCRFSVRFGVDDGLCSSKEEGKKGGDKSDL